MPRFEFLVSVEAEKTSGKFVGKDVIEEELIGEIEGANPNSVSPEDSEYDIVTWDVQAAPTVKDPKVKEATNEAMAGAEPAPRISRLIHDYIRLEANPGDTTLAGNLTASLDELVNAFPKVADSIRAQLARK